MPNVHEIIRDHVSLSTTCIDRLYVNGYVPTLQTGGQLWHFLHDHLGQPIPSPALFRPLHDRFVESVEALAGRNRIPMVQFERGQRKDDIANAHRVRFRGREGVVLIGVAQERAWSFRASKRSGDHATFFDFSRQPVFVKHYYFYVQDPEWGPAFLKIGTYLPYPVKLCLNGHEWVKQQLRKERLRFEALDNGFLSCRQPERLEEISGQLGPEHVQSFFDHWSQRCVALFCSKLFLRILRPAWPALLDQAPDTIPRPLRTAFLKLDAEIQHICDFALLKAAS